MLELPIFARNLRFLRQIRGDTQSDIAELLSKTTKATIAQYEKGRNGMSLTDLMKLCDYYKVGETEFCRSDLWTMKDADIEKLRRRWVEKNELVLESVYS
jgi:transcriptional regulator with XRE-family HTH domain